jgi:RNA polymerase sigma-70 factor (ECF subfamily)
MERLEGVQLLHRLLDELDDDKRIVLVLAELESMTVPEIADTLGENLNTIYARLRAARREFEQAATRERARDTWRLR